MVRRSRVVTGGREDGVCTFGPRASSTIAREELEHAIAAASLLALFRVEAMRALRIEVVVGLVVIVLIVAALMLTRVSGPVAAPPSAPIVAIERPSAPPPTPIAPAPTETVAIEPGVSMAHRYSTSINYWAFIRDARNDLANGGGAYATLAQMVCGGTKAVLKMLQTPRRPEPTDTRIIIARAEARTVLEARCGPVNTDEPLVRVQLKSDGRVTLDPLLRFQDEWWANRAKDGVQPARQSLLTTLLDLQDPLLWERFSGWAVSADLNAGTAWFDGTAYSGPDARALARGAALVSCAMGYDCGTTDTQVAYTCLVMQVCEHDRFELMRLASKQQDFSFERAMDFYGRVLDAVREKRVNAFMKP